MALGDGWTCNCDVAVAIQRDVPYLGHKEPVTRAKAPGIRLQFLLFAYNNSICSVQGRLIAGWQLNSVVCSSLISYRLLPCCSVECRATQMAGLSTALLGCKHCVRCVGREGRKEGCVRLLSRGFPVAVAACEGRLSFPKLLSMKGL